MSVYGISPENSAPIVIGGIGGSGTRLVTQIVQQGGVFFGGDLNEELDNLWFSLLFVRRSIISRSNDDLERLAWLFVNAMRERHPVPEELIELLDEAAQSDRGPALRKSVLDSARASFDDPGLSPSTHTLWGWKQPNSHVLVPMLSQYIPGMKYIYVVRNGLDMAFGYNQNQLKYFWGDLLLESGVDSSPRNALRYWVASYKRNCAYRDFLGDRLYILNFDLLCNSPDEQIQHLYRFLNLDAAQIDLDSVVQSIVVPGSTGRHKHHDCGQLRTEDVEFVKSLGFDVGL